MWRDIERRAAMYGFSVRLPAPYPLKQNALANKLAIIGMEEGWGKEFVCAAYRRWFQLGEESGSEPNVSASLREVGQNPERIVELANSGRADRTLEAETAEARKLDIFGSPTFVVGKELFWGDDRLEDAISWHKYGRLQRAGRWSGLITAASNCPAKSCRSSSVISTIAMTMDTYGHLFPRGDDREELAAAERLLLG
jgi:hypothetical protein